MLCVKVCAHSLAASVTQIRPITTYSLRRFTPHLPFCLMRSQLRHPGGIDSGLPPERIHTLGTYFNRIHGFKEKHGEDAERQVLSVL